MTDKAIVVQEQRAVMTAEDLIFKALDNNVGVEVMERLLAMRERINAERAREAFNVAMAKFQGECPVIKKDKIVKGKDGKVRYSYAPLDSIVTQCKEALERNGFSYMAETHLETIGDMDWVTARIRVTHELGHTLETDFKVPVDKGAYMSEQQKFASALTYAKRYAFCNAFGILTGDEDDDANAHEPTPTKPPPQQKPAQGQPAQGSQPIDIFKDLYGGSGVHKDKAYIDVPSGYLESMKDPKYWGQFTLRKQEAILKTLAYKNKLKAEKAKDGRTEVKQTSSSPVVEDTAQKTPVADSPVFDEGGDLTVKPEEKPDPTQGKELVLKDTLDGYDIPPFDTKREQEAGDPKILEFIEWFLGQTSLFEPPEKISMISNTKKLPYNLVIAQLKNLKKVYGERWEKKYGA